MDKTKAVVPFFQSSFCSILLALLSRKAGHTAPTPPLTKATEPHETGRVGVHAGTMKIPAKALVTNCAPVEIGTVLEIPTAFIA